MRTISSGINNQNLHIFTNSKVFQVLNQKQMFHKPTYIFQSESKVITSSGSPTKTKYLVSILVWTCLVPVMTTTPMISKMDRVIWLSCGLATATNSVSRNGHQLRVTVPSIHHRYQQHRYGKKKYTTFNFSHTTKPSNIRTQPSTKWARFSRKKAVNRDAIGTCGEVT